MKKEDRIKCSNKGCNKEIYKTAEDALDEIERILTTQKKLTDRKPCRAFLCSCGYYALTSKIKVTTY